MKLNKNAKTIYALIVKCQERGFTPSIYELAGAIHISPQMVSRYIKLLEKKNKLKRVAKRRIMIIKEDI